MDEQTTSMTTEVQESRLPAEPIEPAEPVRPFGDPVAPEPDAKPRQRLFRTKKIQDFTPDDDIRFKGRISYRHLTIAGWIFLAAGIASNFLTASFFLSPNLYEKYVFLTYILNVFSNMSIFMFLFANFSTILSGRKTFKQLLTTYTFLTLGVILLNVVFYARYVDGLEKAFDYFRSHLSSIATEPSSHNGFYFNVFLDLLLCTLLSFFLQYRPVKYFTGKKIYIFRAMALLPLLYEAVCIALKILVSSGMIRLPLWTHTFMPTKPVMCFILFIIMSTYVKLEERKFLKTGKTYEEYQEYLKTNTNSFRFAKKFALMLLIVSILDLVIVGIIVLIIQGPDVYTSESDAPYMETYSTIYSWGFGTAFPMFLFIPFALFFSYTKSYKNTQIDSLIPIGGLILLILTVIEGTYHILILLPNFFSFMFG